MLTWQSPAVTLPIRGVLTRRKSDVFEAYASAGWDLNAGKVFDHIKSPMFLLFGHSNIHREVSPDRIFEGSQASRCGFQRGRPVNILL